MFATLTDINSIAFCRCRPNWPMLRGLNAAKASCLVTSAGRVHRVGMFETDRLVLRKWKKGDQPQVASILGDPDVMEFSDHGTLTSEQQAVWLKKALAVRTGDLLSGPFAIALKSTDDVVGYIKLSNDANRNEQSDLEIGFRLSRHAWGNGYAVEAVAGLLLKVDEMPRFTRIVAIVDPHNQRSIRVLEKLGMSRVGEMMFDGYDYPDALYALKLRVSLFRH